MGSLGWLAISDLHAGASGAPSLSKQAADELYRDLERVHKHAGPFDVVLCAGDVVQNGTREDFEARLAVVKELRRVTLQQAAHMMHHDQPEALARAVEEFLG